MHEEWLGCLWGGGVGVYPTAHFTVIRSCPWRVET